MAVTDKLISRGDKSQIWLDLMCRSEDRFRVGVGVSMSHSPGRQLHGKRARRAE